MSCYLNQFPTEIFHLIFRHLWAHEILYSFGKISDYVNHILANYENYLINFESIRKSHFDLVCLCIRPEQVISLILSDKSETPNLSQLFWSLFSIKQFRRLRSLKLIEIEEDAESYVLDLSELPQLMSLEIDVKFDVPLIISSPVLERISINIPNGVHFMIDPFIAAIRYEQLRHLSLCNCSCMQLQKIFRRAVRLTSLKISLAFLTSEELQTFVNFHQNQSKISPLTDLSLSLNGAGHIITRADLERFLASFERLRKLELVISMGAERSFFDALQWENFLLKHIPHLKTFNFSIHTFQEIDRKVIERYRRSFWLDRHWYVACNDGHSALFTVPHFAPSSNSNSSRPISSEYTTLPIEQHIVFYNCITKLRFDEEDTCPLFYRYNHVKEFILNTPYTFENILDLSKVQSFIVTTTEWSFDEMMTLIKEEMPSVNVLSLNWTYVDLLDQDLPDISLPQIRTLKLPEYGQSEEDDLFHWSRYFPRVERLSASINSREQIQFLIDQFRNMVIAHFYLHPDYRDSDETIELTRQWLQKHTIRLRENRTNNFICRIENRFPFAFSVRLWIGDNHRSNPTRKTTQNENRWWRRCFSQKSTKQTRKLDL